MKLKFEKIKSKEYKVFLGEQYLGIVYGLESGTRSYWYFEPNPEFPHTGSSDNPEDLGNWRSWNQTRSSAVYQYYGDYILGVQWLPGVIQKALEHASIKKNKGLLVSLNDPDFEDLIEDTCTPKGDRETVYSISSLFSDNSYNDGTWDAKISSALIERFGE